MENATQTPEPYDQLAPYQRVQFHRRLAQQLYHETANGNWSEFDKSSFRNIANLNERRANALISSAGGELDYLNR